MRLSYKGWFLFSQPPTSSLLVALFGFVVAAIGIAPGGRMSGWELTRLITNILVLTLIILMLGLTVVSNLRPFIIVIELVAVCRTNEHNDDV